MSATRPGDRVVDRDHRQVGLACPRPPRRRPRTTRTAPPPAPGSARGTPGGSWPPARPGRRCGAVRSPAHRSLGPWFLVVLSLVVALAALACARRVAASAGDVDALPRTSSGCARRSPRSGPRPGRPAPRARPLRRLRRRRGPPLLVAGAARRRGNGVVLTAIHGRSEARSYAKSVAGWSCDQPLSPEEQDAVRPQAMTGTGTTSPTSSASAVADGDPTRWYDELWSAADAARCAALGPHRPAPVLADWVAARSRSGGGGRRLRLGADSEHLAAARLAHHRLRHLARPRWRRSASATRTRRRLPRGRPARPRRRPGRRLRPRGRDLHAAGPAPLAARARGRRRPRPAGPRRRRRWSSRWCAATTSRSPTEPPWTLTRAEMEAVAGDGVELESLDEVLPDGPGQPRCGGWSLTRR